MNGQHSDDEVGYGKPPREYRWKKGQSGNPRGRRRRPKRPPPTDLLDSFADALLTEQRVHMDGRDTTVPLFVALVQSLVRDSFKCGFRDRLLLLRYLAQTGVIERLAHRITEEQADLQAREAAEWQDEYRTVLSKIERDWPGLLESFDDGAAPPAS